MRNRRGQPDVVASDVADDDDDDAEEGRAPTAANLANPLSVAAHILVFFLAIGAGRYARGEGTLARYFSLGDVRGLAAAFETLALRFLRARGFQHPREL